MRSEVIEKILSTEDSAQEIVQQAQEMSIEILNEARKKVASDLEVSLKTKREENEKILTFREEELKAALLKEESVKPETKIDSEKVEEVTNKIVSFVANTVYE